jgi:3-oxoacyl-[acyl-carrier-protein] synthase-3
MASIVITGTGSYVPETVLTNEYFSSIVDTTDEWIIQRTGIRERRKSNPGVASSDLMLPAAQKALAMAKKTVADLNLMYVSTSFPDQHVPATSDIFAEKLGTAKDLLAIDVNAQCSGFCWALGQAYDKMRLYPHKYRTVLVVSGDATSKFVDYEDRESCVLFGDGAGAVILERVEEEGCGILGYLEASDRTYINCLAVLAGGSALPASHETVKARQHFMHFGPDGGSPMLKAIVKYIPKIRTDVCVEAGINPAIVNLIVPHQLNQRIVDASKRRSTIEIYDRNIGRYGNCSGSSVAMALHAAYREGKIAKGDYLQLESYGAGMKYGAVVIRWWLQRFQG